MLYSKSVIAVPPGATIREQLEDRGMSQKEFSQRMGMTEKHISRLINGKVDLTHEVALKLESVLGLPASFWNNLEAIYKENIVRAKAEQALEQDMAMAKHFPYAKMAGLGWVKATNRAEEKVECLRAYFEVASLNLLDELRVPGIACRQVGKNAKSDYVLAAWAQKARLEARKIKVAPININRLNENISAIRALTEKPPAEFCDELRKLLSDCGIAIVFLPHIGGSFLHGASFVDGNHIVVGLTVRGRDADRFWFSLFHELCHIIEGHIFNLDETTEEQERTADQFSRDILIPPYEYERFIYSGKRTDRDIISFARSIGIDPGIVLGRLQKENIVPYSYYRELKTQYQISH